MMINFLKKNLALLSFEKLGILTLKQDISKSMRAIALKLDRLIGK